MEEKRRNQADMRHGSREKRGSAGQALPSLLALAFRLMTRGGVISAARPPTTTRLVAWIIWNERYRLQLLFYQPIHIRTVHALYTHLVFPTEAMFLLIISSALADAWTLGLMGSPASH